MNLRCQDEETQRLENKEKTLAVDSENQLKAWISKEEEMKKELAEAKGTIHTLADTKKQLILQKKKVGVDKTQLQEYKEELAEVRQTKKDCELRHLQLSKNARVYQGLTYTLVTIV